MATNNNCVERLQDLINREKEKGLFNIAAFPVSVTTSREKLATAMLEMLEAKTVTTEESL